MSSIDTRRHIAKTATYRIIGTIITIALTLSVGLPLKWASILGIGELVIKPIVYYLHERIWHKCINFNVLKNLNKIK